MHGDFTLFSSVVPGKWSDYSLADYHNTLLYQGRAVYDADRLSLRRSWLHPQTNPRGICGTQSGIETGFFRVLRFFLISIIPLMFHTHS